MQFSSSVVLLMLKAMEIWSIVQEICLELDLRLADVTLTSIMWGALTDFATIDTVIIRKLTRTLAERLLGPFEFQRFF